MAEEMVTPENSCQNENLIVKQEEPKSSVKQYFLPSEKNENSEEKIEISFSHKYLLLFILYSIITPTFLTGIFVNFFLYPNSFIYIYSISLMSIIIYLIISNYKIAIIKNESKNLLTIKCKNYFCCTKFKKNLVLENIVFDIHSIYKIKRGRKDHLIIVNTFKNLSDIDLDTSNIRNNPPKIYYIFKNININRDYSFKGKLNEFINVQKDIITPVFFNITSYMNNQNNQLSKYYFYGNQFSQYMKMCDHFFSYYSNEKYYKKSCHKYTIYIFNLIYSPLVIIGSLYVFFDSEDINLILLIPLISVSVLIIVNIIILLIFILLRQNFLRIDIIYSKNFDRIFIGIVKYNESYKNTFIFYIDSIDRFVLQKKNALDDKYTLKVMFKENNKIEDICEINDLEKNLEGLAFVLNQRLSQKSNSDNNEITTGLNVNK